MSNVLDIPGNMCQGAVTYLDEKIYAVGARIEWDGEQRGVIFEEKQWKFI